MPRNILLLVVGFTVLQFCGPDLSEYQHLRSPQISEMPDQQMLVVTLTGDPNEVGDEAFGTLFKSYYKFDKSDRYKGNSAPRARWNATSLDTMSAWIGSYGLPLANSVSELPEKLQGTPNVSLQTWKYGEVGEILHIGSYEDEQPTIHKLEGYIKNRGYKIVGPHEEVYLKGPGMFLKGNPDKYQTIIRYRVKPMQE